MRHQLTLSRPPLPRPPRDPGALPATLALLLALAAPPARAQPSPPSSPAAPSSPATTRSPAAPRSPTAAPTSPAAARSPATADPPPANADKRALAGKKYEEGAAHAKRRQWQKAYPPLLEAWGYLQHWQIALSLARVEIELGKLGDASRHIVFALGASDLPDASREEAERLLDTLRPRLAGLDIVATAEVRARLILDGEITGHTPFTKTVPVEPGLHRIELHVGTTRVARTATVQTGESRQVKIDLRLPGRNDLLPPQPASTPLTPLVPLIALGGVTVAGIATGAGLWAAADGKGAEARALYDKLPALPPGPCTTPHCMAVHGALKTQERLQIGALASWGIGAAALAGGAALWFLRDRTPSPKGARLAPLLGRETQGLMVQGTW